MMGGFGPSGMHDPILADESKLFVVFVFNLGLMMFALVRRRRRLTQQVDHAC